MRAVIAESYERIHRSNLIGMGILPLQFLPGDSADSLGLTGQESYDIGGLQEGLTESIPVTATAADGRQTVFEARCASIHRKNSNTTGTGVFCIMSCGSWLHEALPYFQLPGEELNGPVTTYCDFPD